MIEVKTRDNHNFPIVVVMGDSTRFLSIKAGIELEEKLHKINKKYQVKK